MDGVWKTFRAAKLGTSAAWALSVTTLAAVLGQGVAHAVTTCPVSPITTPGGSTTSDPSPPDIGGVCGGTQIVGTQGLPTYWEFTWNDASQNAIIDDFTTLITADGGSYSGTLELLDSTGTNVLASTTYFSGSFVGSTADPSISYAMTNGQSYMLGVVATPDPSFIITFTDTPEPASLGIFGSALAALAAFRKRRKLSR